MRRRNSRRQRFGAFLEAKILRGTRVAGRQKLSQQSRAILQCRDTISEGRQLLLAGQPRSVGAARIA